MISLLRRLFKKEPAVVSLRFDELPAWFHAQSSEYLKSFDGIIQEFYHRIKGTTQGLVAARESLLAALPSNGDSVAPRVQNVVGGHRENYARELGILLRCLDLPQETSIMAGIAFAQNVDKQLDIFSQQTKKSFEVTRHLFHAEADVIVEHLRELSSAVRSFQKVVVARHVPLVLHIDKNIAQIHSLNNEHTRLHDELSLKQKRRELAERQCKHNDELLKKLMDGDDFLDYQQMLQRKEQLQNDVDMAKNAVNSFFSQIDRALRKYQHQASDSDKKVIERFESDPCTALVEDDSLAVISVLHALREQLPGLRMRDTDKLVVLLDSDLRQFREQLISCEKQFSDACVVAEKHPVLGRLREIEYKLQHFREQEGRLKKDIVLLEEQLAAYSLDTDLRTIEQDIHTAFAVTLNVAR